MRVGNIYTAWILMGVDYLRDIKKGAEAPFFGVLYLRIVVEVTPIRTSTTPINVVDGFRN